MIIRGFIRDYHVYFDSTCITDVKAKWVGSDGYYVFIGLTSGNCISLGKGSGIRHNGVDITYDGTVDKANEIADIIGEIMILERGDS